MADNRIFLDTNVLIYASLSASPYHSISTSKLTQLQNAGHRFCIGRQTLREFATVMSRPGTLVTPILGVDLVKRLEFFKSKYELIDDGALATQTWLSLLQSHPIGGRRIYDAYLAATAIAAGVPALLTHNVSDFKIFQPQINVMDIT